MRASYACAAGLRPAARSEAATCPNARAATSNGIGSKSASVYCSSRWRLLRSSPLVATRGPTDSSANVIEQINGSAGRASGSRSPRSITAWCPGAPARGRRRSQPWINHGVDVSTHRRGIYSRQPTTSLHEFPSGQPAPPQRHHRRHRLTVPRDDDTFATGDPREQRSAVITQVAHRNGHDAIV